MFEYIGDPSRDGQGPDVLRAWGHVFKKGVPVKIETVVVGGNKITEGHITKKLKGNSHFREVDGRTKEAAAGGDEG